MSVRARFISLQIALATMLLIVTGLLLRSLHLAESVEPGFAARDALLATVNFDTRGYNLDESSALRARINERLESLPSVIGVSWTTRVPLGAGNSARVLWQESGRRTGADYASVGADYFSVMNIPIVRGRGIDDRDQRSAPLSAVVNASLAARAWPGQDAIGKRISLDGSEGPWREVVGIAADGLYRGLDDRDRAFIYAALEQGEVQEATAIVTTRGAPGPSETQIIDVMHLLDQYLPVFDVKSLGEHLQLASLPARLIATLLAVMGGVTFVLAVVGVYGVVALNAVQRMPEMGV